MVNVIMRIGGEQTTMSRSFLMKKYSHCPLKKRPVQFIKEETFECGLSDDNSEPENLSTKPEDLSCKALTPLPAIALISLKKEADHHDEEDEKINVHSYCDAVNERTNVGHFLAKSNGGPLEPLNLNTSVSPHLHHDASTNLTWPRAVPAHYPPHYIPLNYLYPATQSSEILSSYYYSSPPPSRIPAAPSSPYSSTSHRERSSSPLKHAFTPFRASQHAAITTTAATLPPCAPVVPLPDSRLQPPTYNRQPSDSSPLSPTSTSSSNSYPYYAERSPPSVCPEDLSSPGSVSSNSSGSIGSSNSKKSSKNKDGTPRFRCSFCSKSYSTCSGLSKHEQFHCTANEDAALKKKFKCKYCEKEYNSLGALKMHIRTHTLPCKCQLCGKAFSRPWLLQGHIRTHTGEKPFSCPHCNRAFADRSNLRAHLQTHSDVKKYSCPTCSKTFSRMSLLSKHTDGGCPGVSGSGMMHVTTDMKPYFVPVDN